LIKRKMLKDIHVHTKLCKHANGEIREYIEKGMDAGLDEIGFSDHIPFPNGKENSVRMEMEELPEYINEIRVAQKAYNTISIKLGLEAEYLPGCEDYLRDIFETYNFDYILGSIHYISDWTLNNPQSVHFFSEDEVNRYYPDYFRLVGEAAKSGLFDGISHFDLINRNGFPVDNGYYETAEKTLKLIKSSGVALEINTSGFRRKRNEFYPSPVLLKEVIRLGIPLTLGSDAHSPDEVGRDFDRAIDFLLRYGVSNLVTFTDRKKITYNI